MGEDNQVKFSEIKERKSGRAFIVLRDYLFMIIGSLLFAVAIDMFTAPNDVVTGGVTGIATMLNYLFGLPIGIMTLVINIPLFVWGAIENGRRFLIKTAFATVLSSLFIDLLIPYLPLYKGDKFMASLFGGILIGAGLALVFFGGGTTGGTDIVSKNLQNHFPFLSMGTVKIFADIFVIAATMIVYKSIESGLYAIIIIFVSSKVIDTTIYGLSHDIGKIVFIMSSKYDEISQAIMKDIKRGVTLLDSTGGYTGTTTKTIMCAVRPRQVYKVKNIASSIDKNAFFIVTKAGIINGEGFENQ